MERTVSQINESVLPLLCTCAENASLTESSAGVGCETCGTQFSKSEGFYDLEPDQEYYWNEFTQEEMRDLLDLGWRDGWDAMATAVAKAEPVMEELLRSGTRVDSIYHCYSPDRAQSCLDVGCGWGTITEILSHLYDDVWSMDGVSERLEATRIRLQDKEIDNVHLVRNFLPRMPFADNTFDMVVIKGVLEWIPLATTEHPTETQRNFLREVYRVLKPGGALLLGIENRFGAPYLLGVPDHTGLHFTSFLPRRLADLAVRWNHRRKDDIHKISHQSTTAYRPYTYNRAGYRKLMDSAGFDETDIYWAKSYQVPQYSGPINSANVRFFLQAALGKFRRFQGLVRAASALFNLLPDFLIELALKTFTPTFLICGYKGSRPKTLQSELLSTLEDNQTWIKVGGSHAEQGRIQYFIFDKSNPVPKRILAFARFPEFTESLAREYDCLAQFSGISTQRTDYQSGEQDNQPERGRAVWLSPYIDSAESNDPAALARGVDWLAAWQQRTNTTNASQKDLATHVAAVFADVQTYASPAGIPWAKIAESVQQYLGSTTIDNVVRCAEHRDFSVSNVRMAHRVDDLRDAVNVPEGSAADQLEDGLFVIDWDLYQEDGWPFFDAINYLLSYYAPAFHAENFRAALSTDEFHTMLASYAQKLALPDELLWHMIPYHLARSVIDSHQDGLLYRIHAEPLAAIWLEEHQRRSNHRG